MMFIELPKRTYWRGRYVSENMLVAIDDISRVVQCTDDCSLTNIVTKDGEVHTISDRYENVVKKICNAERWEEGERRMTREEALNVLTNVAWMLHDGTRFLKQEHEEQFHKAYEMAMDALRQPEIILCKDCKHRGEVPIADGRFWCEIHDTFMYYCSDAERREEGNE